MITEFADKRNQFFQRFQNLSVEHIFQDDSNSAILNHLFDSLNLYQIKWGAGRLKFCTARELNIIIRHPI